MQIPSHVHLIGIGGTGISAIARVLHERGHQVSGSDRTLSPLAADLQAQGVAVRVGHQAANLNGAELVVRSSAVPDDNVEVKTARERGIPVLKRSDFLADLMAGQTGIAVAGSHGKTTTTSMIAWLLTALRQDPSFIVGGIIANLNTNAKAGNGPHFVIEADEYDRMFHGLRPEIAIITNVEHDHPDCFPTEADFVEAFQKFAGLVGRTLFLCGDDKGVCSLLDTTEINAETFTYGLEADNDFYPTDLVATPGAGYAFDVNIHGVRGSRVRLLVPGLHNVQNALAALAVAHRLGLPHDESVAALSRFTGSGRRFDERGEYDGVMLVDDYAHHPTEIRATLEAARQRYPGKTVWAVWQPHTYSRTLTLLDAYREAFVAADHLIVTDVYAARETPPAEFSIQTVVDTLKAPDKRHIGALDDVSAYLCDHLQANAVVLTLSAGSAVQITQDVKACLSGE